MSDKNKKKEIPEFVYILICIILCLFFAKYLGLIEGFSLVDFENAFNKISSNVEHSSIKGKLSMNNRNYNNINGRYDGVYKSIPIQPATIEAIKYTKVWKNLFYGSSKVVFYFYESSDSNFDITVKNFITEKKLSNIYRVYAYNKSDFENRNQEDIEAATICNSLDECKATRNKAVGYNNLTHFLEYCGETMCIINPNKKAFIRLKNKDSYEAINLINNVRSW